MSFVAELKRRNVFRVAAAYLVIGWLLTEVASAVLPTFGAPDWVTKVVVFLFVLGFPIALFLAWAFEVTPEGIQREGEVSHDSAAARASARKLDLATLVGVVLVIAMFAYQQFSPSRPMVTVEAPAEAVAVSNALPSIAVLAFDNMSPDPENAFFAEGISEEILNVLAGIEGLRVASRTSAFSFAGTDVPITDIAQQLDVANVLEGSVRRQGMRVRITAQLIDARTDTHLWSDTYDRDLDDIFAVQEEIANSITDAMRDALGVRQVSVQASTGDLAAYELFLHGRQLFYERGESLATAIESLQAAVERDPGFADAWAYLAAAAGVAPGYSSSGYDHERADPIRDAALAQALSLDPDNAQALAGEANLMMTRGEDVAGAIDRYRRAVELAPSDSSALTWWGNDLSALGYRAEATTLLERAYRVDPLVGIVNGVLGVAYYHQGRETLGAERFAKAESLGWYGHLGARFAHLVAGGEVDAAVQMFVDLTDEDDEENLRSLELWRAALLDADQVPEYYAFIDEIQARDGRSGFLLIYQTLRDRDRFFDGLAWSTVNNPDWGFQMRTIWLPSARWIVEDPRFLEIAETLPELGGAWAVLGDPDGCVRVSGPAGEHLDCSERFGGPPE
jgi:TolB-like protein/Tfp pilus assembly protein PilF